MSGHEKPDAPGLWKAAHGGYGVMFHDDGEPAMLLFGPGAKVRALDAIGPYTRLQPGVPVGSAPVPNLPGLWMDKDGSLYFLSGGRRVWRIRDDHDWMAEELGNDPWELSKHGPYARYSLQAVEEVPWKPASDDSTPIHEGFCPRTHITAERGAETMSKTKQPLPYDPKLIAEQCNPLALRLGCAAGCWKGENFDMCGKPPVAIRRWARDDGYDDSGLLPEEGVYGPACKLHANHDVVPLAVILDVMLGGRR